MAIFDDIGGGGDVVDGDGVMMMINKKKKDLFLIYFGLKKNKTRIYFKNVN